jgi:hypothetical protein
MWVNVVSWRYPPLENLLATGGKYLKVAGKNDGGGGTFLWL